MENNLKKKSYEKQEKPIRIPRNVDLKSKTVTPTKLLTLFTRNTVS